MKATLRFLLLGLLIAVTARFDSGAMAAGALQTIAVATSAAGQTGYIAALIEAKGIAAEHGLKIDNLRMDFTEAANALKLGRAVASAMQPSTAVNLVKSGTNIRLITPQIWSGNAWVVRKESPYKALADLKGKKSVILRESPAPISFRR
jgi:ABC-type nitrate/sulfonate/bicarbonate transport system substrate-binding protein